jgi:hypothetical protein
MTDAVELCSAKVLLKCFWHIRPTYEEHANMHFIYIFCNGNDRAAVVKYQHCSQNCRVSHQMCFTMYTSVWERLVTSHKQMQYVSREGDVLSTDHRSPHTSVCRIFRDRCSMITGMKDFAHDGFSMIFGKYMVWNTAHLSLWFTWKVPLQTRQQMWIQHDEASPCFSRCYSVLEYFQGGWIRKRAVAWLVGTPDSSQLDFSYEIIWSLRYTRLLIFKAMRIHVTVFWLSEVLVSYHITTCCHNPKDHELNLGVPFWQGGNKAAVVKECIKEATAAIINKMELYQNMMFSGAMPSAIYSSWRLFFKFSSVVYLYVHGNLLSELDNLVVNP